MSEKKACPLNRNYLCDNDCKWFDEDDDDCNLLLNISDISTEIRKGLDALFQKS